LKERNWEEEEERETREGWLEERVREEREPQSIVNDPDDAPKEMRDVEVENPFNKAVQIWRVVERRKKMEKEIKYPLFFPLLPTFQTFHRFFVSFQSCTLFR
jgi:hypothetical protein